MRCAVDPEAQGAAARMPSHSSRCRSAVFAISDPRFSVRPCGDRSCRFGVAGARRRPRPARRRLRRVETAGPPRRAARGARRRVAEDARWRREHAPDPHGLGQRLHREPEDAILVNEYTLMPEHCGSNLPGSYFGSSTASGLGWGGGAALGAKLAPPHRLVIAGLGDGSPLFGNPVAVHHASAVHKLPILFVVMNNSMWGAVRRATLGMYPQGEAARSNKPPLIDLDELPAFEQVCAASGGYGERVEDPAALPAALDRAVRAVTVEKRHARLNVICRGV